MDVRVRDVPGDAAAKLARQRQVYRDVVAACLAEPRCEAVTFWGFTDAHSWIDGFFGPDDPLPFDEQYRAKPAFFGVQDAFLGRSEPTIVNGSRWRSRAWPISSCTSSTRSYEPSGRPARSIPTRRTERPSASTATGDDGDSRTSFPFAAKTLTPAATRALPSGPFFAPTTSNWQ